MPVIINKSCSENLKHQLRCKMFGDPAWMLYVNAYTTVFIRRLIFHKGRHVWTRRRPNKAVKAICCDSFSNILLITCHSLRSKILLISVEGWRELIDINGSVDAEVQEYRAESLRGKYRLMLSLSFSSVLLFVDVMLWLSTDFLSFLNFLLQPVQFYFRDDAVGISLWEIWAILNNTKLWFFSLKQPKQNPFCC